MHMPHTVALQSYTNPDQWSEIARFRWHADAIEYAREISGSGRWGGRTRVETADGAPTIHYRHGREVADQIMHD